MRQEDKRLQIAALLNAGHGTADIVKQLQVHWHTVYMVKNRLKNGQDLKDHPHSGKPHKLTSEVMKKAFLVTPEMKMTAFTEKKFVHKSTVSRAIKATGGKSRKTKKPLLSTKTSSR